MNLTKLLLCFALILLWSGKMHAQSKQQVTAVQYFFDTDPGTGIQGNGGIVAVTPTSNLNQLFNFTIPGSLTQGIHALYVRAKDEYGRWSIAERRDFYVAQLTQATQQVTAVQYF